MATTIDITKPEAGKATTQSIRDNFEAIKNLTSTDYYCTGSSEDAVNITDIIDTFYRERSNPNVSLKLSIFGRLLSGTISPTVQNQHWVPVYLDFRSCAFPATQNQYVLNSNRGNHIFFIEGLRVRGIAWNTNLLFCRGKLVFKNCQVSGSVTSTTGGITAIDTTLSGPIASGTRGPIDLRNCNIQSTSNSLKGGSIYLDNVNAGGRVITGGPITLFNVRCATVNIRNYSRLWIQDSYIYGSVSAFRCQINIENTVISASGNASAIAARGTSQRAVRLVNCQISASNANSIFTRQVLVMSRCQVYAQHGIVALNTIRIDHCRIEATHATGPPGIQIGSVHKGYSYHPALITNTYIRSYSGVAVAIREFRTGMIKFSGCFLSGYGISPIPQDVSDPTGSQQGKGPYAIRANPANTGVGIIVENCNMRNMRTAGLSIDPCIYQQSPVNSIKWHLMGNRYSGSVIYIQQSSTTDAYYTPNSYVYMPQFANKSSQIIEGFWEETLQ